MVFDSAVDGFFLNHSDFTAQIEDLTSMPAGPTGLPPWPDFLVRLTRAPVASIALIRGRATGNGSEITLACDMAFASRERTLISQWEPPSVGESGLGRPIPSRLRRLTSALATLHTAQTAAVSPADAASGAQRTSDQAGATHCIKSRYLLN
ncbi:MAG: hypothetical protein JF615_14965 [Asticcacaulis sp.]|nr:hypothetical protein [Asticcacaulis sp.]